MHPLDDNTPLQMQEPAGKCVLGRRTQGHRDASRTSLLLLTDAQIIVCLFNVCHLGIWKPKLVSGSLLVLQNQGTCLSPKQSSNFPSLDLLCVTAWGTLVIMACPHPTGGFPSAVERWKAAPGLEHVLGLTGSPGCLGQVGTRTYSSQTWVTGLAEEEWGWRVLSIILFFAWIYSERTHLHPDFLLLHRHPAPSQL